MTRRVLAITAAVWLGAIRRKDVYVMLILLGGLFGTIVSADVFGLGGMTTYIQDIGLLLAWIFSGLLAVLSSSRELPSEEMRGTLLHLLARPVSRFGIILGKWLGTWTLTLAATALFYLLVSLSAAAAGGRLDAAAWLQAFLCHALCLAVITSLGILFSVRCNGDAAAALTGVLSAAAFLMIPRIPEMQVQASPFGAGVLEVLYHILPHFDVFDMRLRIVHDFGPLKAGVLLEIAAYGVALTAFILTCAWAAFRTRKIDRKGATL
jgi:ABC-type Na+ efflux pump permease subunit